MAEPRGGVEGGHLKPPWASITTPYTFDNCCVQARSVRCVTQRRLRSDGCCLWHPWKALRSRWLPQVRQQSPPLQPSPGARTPAEGAVRALALPVSGIFSTSQRRSPRPNCASSAGSKPALNSEIKGVLVGQSTTGMLSAAHTGSPVWGNPKRVCRKRQAPL
ncbi:hypothetical protein H920_01800 [Fukomys damarensis]|uniref:Uncharacterized protein n=1 Tax=Fukomys damarensis TaxID=885580 RepID=A0A091E2N3_FUKDA|nr:hypothetical protein H920_01800 [Fukomys damarensis]